jgi:hypothetical protein
MNDNDVLESVKGALSGVHMHTPVESIVAGGRSRRRRRVAGRVAVGAALAVGLAVGVPAVGHYGAGSPSADGNGVRLAAFSVVSNPNGTATVTLAKGPGLDPDALRAALAQADVPAVVRVGEFCHSGSQPPGLDQVLSSQRTADGTVMLIIDPAATPPGAELSIGFKPDSTPGTKDRIRFTLVTAGADLSCDSFR